MNNIIIRPAEYEEFSLVLELTREAYAVPYKEGSRSSRPHENEGEEKNFLNGKFFVLLAEKDSVICGVVRYRFDDDSTYLYNLAVPEQYRRQGIGKSLVEAVSGVARKKGFTKLKLDCMEEKGLPAYYNKLGFVIDKTKKHHDHHDVYMSRILL
jgi:ribosomal protein S18 acetylase RimI-like enzyme